MNNQKVVSSGGIGFWGLLQIAFIVLRLTGVIEWPWAMVLLPAIAAIGFYVVVFVGIVVLWIIASVLKRQ